MEISHDFKFHITPDELHKRFIAALRFKPITLSATAHEIGISVQTLKNFIKDARVTHYVTLCKIEDWVIGREKEKIMKAQQEQPIHS